MDTDLTVKDLIERNKQYAAIHEPLPFFAELEVSRKAPSKLAIITCADPRCAPERFLQLARLDAIVFRNACGHAAPFLGGFVAIGHLLGGVHRGDDYCGASHYTNDAVKGSLKDRLPADMDIEELDFGAITDIEHSIKDDVAVLEASPLIRAELKANVHGFVFDIKTGLLTAVDT